MKLLRWIIAACFFALVFAAPTFAAEPVFKSAAGVNGAWFTGPQTAFPNDVELGGNTRASLSPHISAVGSVYYGFSNSYLRYAGGVRVTASDVTNPNFSIGLGLQYRGNSKSALGPNEWASEATVGWRPWPEAQPNIVLVGQEAYGLQSFKYTTIVGVRYAFDFPGF